MNLLNILAYGLLALATYYAGGDAQAIENLIEAYNHAGEKQLSNKLEGILSNDFRVVLKDQNTEEVKVLDRATYVKLIDSKAFGGQERKTSVHALNISNGLTATAEVLQAGTDDTLHSHISLIKQGGQWQIVQVLVFIS